MRFSSSFRRLLFVGFHLVWRGGRRWFFFFSFPGWWKASKNKKSSAARKKSGPVFLSGPISLRRVSFLSVKKKEGGREKTTKNVLKGTYTATTGTGLIERIVSVVFSFLFFATPNSLCVVLFVLCWSPRWDSGFRSSRIAHVRTLFIFVFFLWRFICASCVKRSAFETSFSVSSLARVCVCAKSRQKLKRISRSSWRWMQFCLFACFFARFFDRTT